MAIDPVCRMPVERERSIALEQDGRLEFFCSRGCRDEFLGLGPVREEARAEELVRRVLDTPDLLRSVFQPILSLETREVIGYEALARFAAVPLQPPEGWFVLAARAGLRPDLEALALRNALAVVARRPPPAGMFVSFNVSPLLLDDRRIASLLVDAAVPVAIDDAGAGYASLRHITELQPDIVKLDARLIEGLTSDLARQALVRAMSTFVDEIGAVLVAEGVEQLEDLDLLVRAGRPMLIQGYVVGRAADPWPAASDRVVRHLRRAAG